LGGLARGGCNSPAFVWMLPGKIVPRFAIEDTLIDE